MPTWVWVMAVLAAFLTGVGLGAILAWEDDAWRRSEARWRRRRGGFVSPGIGAERLALADERRERRAGRPRLRPVADDAIEGPPEFHPDG